MSQPTPRPAPRPVLGPDGKPVPGYVKDAMAAGLAPKSTVVPTTPLPGLELVSTNDLATGGARKLGRTVLYKGVPLSGKTYAIGSWTAAGPMLYVLFDPKSETIEQFPDVFILAPKDHTEFMDKIFPRIVSGTVTDRQGKPIEYATVGLDSLSFFAREAEQFFMAGADEMPDGGWQPFANRLARVFGNMRVLTKGARPVNFVASVHEQDRTKQVKVQGRREVVVEGTMPMISGRMRDQLESYFDLVLLTQKEVAVVSPPGSTQRVTETRYFCRTIGTEKKQAAGGGFGGLKSLPPRVDGTYPGLCKLAGLDPRTLLPLSTVPVPTITVSEEPSPDPEEGEGTGTDE